MYNSTYSLQLLSHNKASPSLLSSTYSPNRTEYTSACHILYHSNMSLKVVSHL